MAAHNVAQDVLALLKDHQTTDADIDFCESIYTHEVGPQLLKPVGMVNPLIDIVSPLTPAISLHISTKARPNAQGMMALFFAKGGGSDRLLSLSCHHVLIRPKDANLDYVYHSSLGPPRDILLLGRCYDFPYFPFLSIPHAIT